MKLQILWGRPRLPAPTGLPSFADSYKPWLLLLVIEAADEGHLETTIGRVNNHYAVGDAARPRELARASDEAEGSRDQYS